MLYSHYKKATTPQDEVRYLHALGEFSDPALLQQSIDLVFSTRSGLRTPPTSWLASWRTGRGLRLAWEAIEQHWDEMVTRWPPNTAHRMLESLPSLVAAGDEVAQRAFAWLDAHPLGTGERKVVQARERLRVNLAFSADVAGQLAAVLAAPSPGAP